MIIKIDYVIIHSSILIMKSDTHPPYEEIQIVCSCGNKFNTRSTLCKEFHPEICSKCHPFYTGKLRSTETVGRAALFRQKYRPKTAETAETKE